MYVSNKVTTNLSHDHFSTPQSVDTVDRLGLVCFKDELELGLLTNAGLFIEGVLLINCG